MSKSKNPYPESLIDQVSGITVPDIRHQIWAEGYKAGRESKDRQSRIVMIETAIKCPNNMVMVFDKRGEQIPEYQGQYEEVKEKISKDAPPEALFGYFLNYETELEIVPREKW